LSPERRPPRPIVLLAAALLLLIAFLQMKGAAAVTSAVVDEPAHLTAGYLSLARFDLRVNREHPPLMKAIAAAPLLLMHPVLPPIDPSGPKPGSEDFEFDYSRKFLYRANDAARLLDAARLPIMILTLLLGALVFVWAREVGGDAAGLSALLLFVTEPNLLAHGRLVTTDLGAAAFSLAFLYALRRAFRASSLRWAAACGLCLGAALLSKFSTLLLFPAGAAAILLDALARSGGGLDETRRSGAAPGRLPVAFRRLAAFAIPCVLILATAWLALEAGYGFGGLPLPRLWLQGIDLARIKNATVEGPTYLMGAISKEGFASYYLIALAVKTPLPHLLLAAAGIVLLLARRDLRPEAGWILAPSAVWIGAMSFLTRAQIGLRYVLPVTPLLVLAGGIAAGLYLRRARAAEDPAPARRPVTEGGTIPAEAPDGNASPDPREEQRRRGRRWAMAAVPILFFAVAAFDAARIYPYHLAYFNEIAGGPEQGWRWLVDSNLDWGQDLIGLREKLRLLGDPEVNLYYFGTADPDAIGLRHRPYGSPAPGLFAISATHLAGVYLPDPDFLADFRRLRPIESVGHSIYLYRLDAVPPRLLPR